MFHGGAKYSTERAKASTKVLNIPRRGSNGPRMCQIFHGEGQIVHWGAKYSTERVKWSTEVPNIRRTMRQIFHGGAKYSTERVSTEVLNIARTMLKIPRRCQTYDGDCQMFHGEGQIFHGGSKYSTERVKCSTEVLNIPQTM